MQRLDLEKGVARAFFLHREFAHQHLGHGRGKRATANVVALFAPQATAQAVSLQVVQSRELVQRPIGVDRSGAFEV